MMYQLDKKQITDMAEHLQGTCSTVQESMRLHGIDESYIDEVMERIEEEGCIFLCDVCGWWCEDSERGNDDICEDCSEDDEEE